MSNERNAGRKPKYGKVELRALQRKVPVFYYTEIANKVDEILSGYFITPEQLKSITNTSNPSPEIAAKVRNNKEGI